MTAYFITDTSTEWHCPKNVILKLTKRCCIMLLRFYLVPTRGTKENSKTIQSWPETTANSKYLQPMPRQRFFEQRFWEQSDGRDYQTTSVFAAQRFRFRYWNLISILLIWTYEKQRRTIILVLILARSVRVQRARPQELKPSLSRRSCCCVG